MHRQITGVVYNLKDQPLTKGSGYVTLLDNSYTNTTQYIISSVKYAIDSQGNIYNPDIPTEPGLSLWVNSEGKKLTRYRFHFPDKTYFDFSLLPGTTDVSLSELRGQSILETPPTDTVLTEITMLFSQLTSQLTAITPSVTNFSWGEVSPKNIELIPAGRKLTRARIVITEVFNTPTTLKLGYANLSSAILSESEVSPHLKAEYSVSPNLIITSPTQVYLTIQTSLGNNQGKGYIILEKI